MNSPVWAGTQPAADEFSSRHIGPSAQELDDILAELGVASLAELIDQVVPESIRQQDSIGFGEGMTETQVLAHMRAIAEKNQVLTSLIGQGYHGTILPPPIQRNILENPAWYTAYTPYQPEISQGRLEAMLNFQTMVADLCGLDIANSSLLDESTAAAEAMALSRRVSRSKVDAYFVDQDCHPQTLDLLRTRAEPMGWELVIGDPATDLQADQVFGAIFQYPGSSGAARDWRKAIAAVNDAGGVATMIIDPLAQVLLESPGDLGATVAVGSMQRFGVPMGFGGPHAGFMAVRDDYRRNLPGRLVGVSIDAHGKPAYRLALATREQHIRREKATSNICTAQVLLAVIASMYGVYHGPDGLTAIARRVARLASVLAAGLRALGETLASEHFFDTITVEAGERADAIHQRALAAGINLRRTSATQIGITLDETTTPAVVEAVWNAFADDQQRVAGMVAQLEAADDAVPDSLRRRSAFMQHPVFHMHRSETKLMRYMRRLADMDLALDRTMIPLGSCTMKLNAAVEMLPITWPEFSNVHPFVPDDQAVGYHEMIADLSARLCAISGYDAMSVQPNSGANGEYAGLLAIRRYHQERGDGQRDICLIPASAHGTNPASAQMAGMRVVVVACDDNGNVDVDDLRAKAAKHAERVAAIMITYPSTHGVFEQAIREICAIVHEVGGQVYLDGANLNAQVGLAQPGKYGADVSHFNLHKTFCIPHGGGGPGVGPIGVRAHLAPYLPGHVHLGSSHAVSGAPYGSASILPISWAYMLLMGDEQLKRASEVAIANANYIVARLKDHYPILFRDDHGRVAHECIVDLRPFRDSVGVTVDDVVKRLMDHGFHPPTMSFPVPGTLMIEPTESEGRAELDRFCDAMIAIREEIRAVESGQISADDSPLRHAPHTAADMAGEWQRKYDRATGILPAGVEAGSKYWPPVNRLDHVWGDKNLMCSCPPLDSYVEDD